MRSTYPTIKNLGLKVDVATFLEKVGIQNVSVKRGYVMYSCPLDGHNHGDEHPSASINPETGMWRCYACEEAGSIVRFVRLVEGMEYADAKEWLRERYGDGFFDPGEDLIGYLEENESTFEVAKGPLPEIERTWDPISEHPDELAYMLSRGFDVDLLEEFEIGAMPGLVIIPYRDEKRRLVGAKARFTEPMPGGHRYYAYAPEDGFAMTRVIYGAHRHNRGHVVVIEGEFNAMSATQKGVRAVGLPSKYCSEEHARIICDRYESATLLFDSDAPGKVGLLNAYELISASIPVDLCPEHEGDANSMDAEELHALLQCAGPPWMAGIYT